jgi:hypothetical protein
MDLPRERPYVSSRAAARLRLAKDGRDVSDDDSDAGETAPEEDDARRGSDPRVALAFRAWLEALATDPDAVTAAAMAYESLAADGRDAWLDALAVEGPSLRAPALALYAPLLGVETDPTRRARIEAALASTPALQRARGTLRCLHGVDGAGASVAAIVIPLYLDFVEVLICRYDPDVGVSVARRGPLLHASDVWTGARALREVEGTAVSESSISFVIEGLAHALVADRRSGRPPPEPLRTYEHLFTLDLGAQTNLVPRIQTPPGGTSQP